MAWLPCSSSAGAEEMHIDFCRKIDIVIELVSATLVTQLVVWTFHNPVFSVVEWNHLPWLFKSFCDLFSWVFIWFYFVCIGILPVCMSVWGHSFRAECSKVSHSLHIVSCGSLCYHLLQLLWRGLIDSLICGCSSISLEVIWLLCSFHKVVVVGSSLGHTT